MHVSYVFANYSLHRLIRSLRADERTNGHTDGQTDGQTEVMNLVA